MTFAPHSILVWSLVLAGLALIFSAYTENGGGSNGATSANTVAVSGTRIVAMNDNDQMGSTRTSFIGNRPRRSIPSDDDPSPTATIFPFFSLWTLTKARFAEWS